MEWTRQTYNSQYEKWVPWMEDKYLAWFGQNKTSYVAKGELDKTKITNNDQINKIQDTVNEGLTGQLGKGGLGEEAGKLTSDQVFTRSERQGKGSGGGLL